MVLTSTQMLVEVCSSMRSVGAGDLESWRLRKMTFVPFFTRKPPPVRPELLPTPMTVVLTDFQCLDISAANKGTYWFPTSTVSPSAPNTMLVSSMLGQSVRGLTALDNAGDLNDLGSGTSHRGAQGRKSRHAANESSSS